MYALQLCRKYLDAINCKDLASVLNLFVSDATVKAPLTGVMTVEDFHAQLFKNRRQSIARLLNVFDSLKTPRSVALQFSFTWVLSNGKTLVMDGINVFEMDEHENKFKNLTIIHEPKTVKGYLTDQQVRSVSLG